MDRIHAAPLALAASMALTTPALACRDAQTGKPWRPKDAAPGPVVQTIDVATESKVFLVGTAAVKRVHFCVRMALPDPTDQSGTMGLYLWAKTNTNYYLISITNNKIRIVHYLYRMEAELVPPTQLDVAKKSGDRMIEVDVKANGDGADVEVDGEPVANIIARPPADDGKYGLKFDAAPGRRSSFRLGPVLTFGDGR